MALFKLGVILLPLLAALASRLAGGRYPLAAHRLAVITFSLTGLVGPLLFYSGGYDRCILAVGRQSCLFDGLATLSLFLLGLALAINTLAHRPLAGAGRRSGHTLGLLLIAAWAGMGLAENLLVFLLAFNLFLYVIYAWLTGRGLKWRILVLRDDYEDVVKK